MSESVTVTRVLECPQAPDFSCRLSVQKGAIPAVLEAVPACRSTYGRPLVSGPLPVGALATFITSESGFISSSSLRCYLVLSLIPIETKL
jgi:hypothetical protein